MWHIVVFVINIKKSPPTWLCFTSLLDVTIWLEGCHPNHSNLNSSGMKLLFIFVSIQNDSIFKSFIIINIMYQISVSESVTKIDTMFSLLIDCKRILHYRSMNIPKSFHWCKQLTSIGNLETFLIDNQMGKTFL